MELLQWWSIPRRGWIIILGELAVIITLGSWVYSEYVNNTYFQNYVNSLSPILLPIVSVGFGITSATVATLLYFTMRNIRQREGPKEEELSRRRASTKKTIKKPQFSSSRSENAKGGLATAPRPKALVAEAARPRRVPAQDSVEEDGSD
jgi:hypothetical protein